MHLFTLLGGGAVQIITCLILVHYVQESNDLECLTRLLQLGLKSLRLIDTKEYYEDKLVIN